MMNNYEAIDRVKKNFPFPGYIEDDPERYITLLTPVLKYLKPPGRILDFGAGPAEKTAMLAALGYDCVAFDDLQDDWHDLDDNRGKILGFANKFKIAYHLDSHEGMPFHPEEFDLIMMHGVLEHLHDSPREVLNKLLTFLKPQGYFYATVPNAANLRKRLSVLRGQTNYQLFESYFWSPNTWRGHVREYVRDDFVKLATFLNLEILELYGSHQMLRLLPNRLLRRLYLALSAVFPNIKDTWVFLAKKKPGWVPSSLSNEDQYKILYQRNPALHKILEQRGV